MLPRTVNFLFVYRVSCFNALTVRLHSICSYHSGFIALRNLEKYAKDALNCWVIRCETLDLCYFTGTLLFIVEFLRTCCFFFRVQCICIIEPISDSLSIPSLRTQRVHSSGYPELRTDMETCKEFCSTASYHMIQLCDSHTAFRVLLTCYFTTLSFSLYVQNW